MFNESSIFLPLLLLIIDVFAMPMMMMMMMMMIVMMMFYFSGSDKQHCVSNWRELKTKDSTMSKKEKLSFGITHSRAPYTRDPVERARWNPYHRQKE